MTDGAAACLVASRQAASQHGLPILGTLRSVAIVGVPPDIMGVGPAVAIPEALKRAGLTVDDIDVYEINEAFASQCLYCVRELGIPVEKVKEDERSCHVRSCVSQTLTNLLSSLLLFAPHR